MARAKVVWTGVDSGLVKEKRQGGCYPFLIKQKNPFFWSIQLGGGVELTQRGDWTTLPVKDIEREIIALIFR